jgi:glutamyl-tRNA reductase
VSLILVGVSQRELPLEVFERVAIGEPDAPEILLQLTSTSELSEVVVVSTCARAELYVVAERFHPAVREACATLGRLIPPDVEDFENRVYIHYEQDAVRHLFAVASGIDSAVLGESEILGQVRSAWELAQGAGTAGPGLSSLFRHAVEVGKRSRTETSIARGITSLAHAAVSLGAERLGGLDGREIVVCGIGRMGAGMSQALGDVAARSKVVLLNRTVDSAARIAEELGAEARSIDSLGEALASADLFLTSTAAPSRILDADHARRVIDARGGRALVIVDLAVPRDIDPGVGHIEGITLFDIVDVQRFADAAMAERRREVDCVRAIVDEEVERYAATAAAREVAPLVSDLRGLAEDVRRAELRKYRSRLGMLDERQREAVEGLTRAIVNKLLHSPTVRLKEAAGTSRGDRLAEALCVLFDLSEAESQQS